MPDDGMWRIFLDPEAILTALGLSAETADYGLVVRDRHAAGTGS